MTVNLVNDEGTLGEWLQFLRPGADPAAPPSWPPDLFAVTATVLQKSGAYCWVITEWPPDVDTRTATWEEEARQVAGAWRGKLAEAPPPPVGEWWARVHAKRDTPLSAVKGDRELSQTLLRLCSVADEASEGAGLPPAGDPDELARESWRLFNESGEHPDGPTLCHAVHRSKARVLPKFHTPQSGITIRSLSHHLALWTSAEVVPSWFTVPIPSLTSTRDDLNLLVLPWPKKILAEQFAGAQPPHGHLKNMPGEFGFFTFEPANPDEDWARLGELLDRATALAGGRLDGVILPELAVTADEHARMRDELMKRGAFLLCGVATSGGQSSAPGTNSLAFDLPVGGQAVQIEQHKHHRWKLDRRQIEQYGLEAQLDPQVAWWEHTALKPRRLTFVALKKWLTVCGLICEDLARQDPVAELVRAVGPNLVVALLMDGPQLAARWPGRYATVLADDPGSSVLTLTSIGMAELCQPPAGQARSRIIALWKDARSGQSTQIELPAGAEGLVLTLERSRGVEFAADGRRDGATESASTWHPRLADVRVLRMGGRSTAPDGGRTAAP